MRLTINQIEELAKEIRQFLLDNNIWQDVTIYFNGKAFSTDDRAGNFYYNDPNHLIELDNQEPTFKYVADPHILSMSFEGPFCGCLNHYNEYGAEFDNRIMEGFNGILNRYGLFYELGEHWNLTCYPTNPEDYPQPEPKKKPIYFYGKSPNDVIVPGVLLDIQRMWKEQADAYGDHGSCVLGAGFKFTYEGQEYFMPPISRWQGSISWEHCIKEIQSELEKAGAINICYEYGRMD